MVAEARAVASPVRALFWSPIIAILLVNLGIALALVIGRFYGLKSQSFQAAAHLYCGGVAVAWWDTRDPFYLAVLLSISLAEVIAFLAFRQRGETSAPKEPR